MEIRKKLLYLGALSPIIAYIFIFSAIAVAGTFSWPHNALSDLGIAEPWNNELVPLLFNTGLILSGMFYALFSIGFILSRDSLVGRIGGIVILLDAIALIGIGVFPENIRDLHMFFSVMFFVLLPIALFVLTADFYFSLKDKNLAIASLLLGLIAMIIWLAVPWKSLGVTRVAIPEFLSSLCGTIWLYYLLCRIGKT